MTILHQRRSMFVLVFVDEPSNVLLRRQCCFLTFAYDQKIRRYGVKVMTCFKIITRHLKLYCLLSEVGYVIKN